MLRLKKKFIYIGCKRELLKKGVLLLPLEATPCLHHIRIYFLLNAFIVLQQYISQLLRQLRVYVLLNLRPFHFILYTPVAHRSYTLVASLSQRYNIFHFTSQRVIFAPHRANATYRTLNTEFPLRLFVVLTSFQPLSLARETRSGACVERVRGLWGFYSSINNIFITSTTLCAARRKWDEGVRERQIHLYLCNGAFIQNNC